MSAFDELNQEIDDGRGGRNKGIPMGFDRLNKYIGLRKKMYFLIGGLTGSGKTAMVDSAFVLNPADYIMSDRNTEGRKLKIVYRSMERGKTYKLAKWLVRKIFLDTGKTVSLGEMLGWYGELSDEKYELIQSYKEYIDKLTDIVEIIDGPANPINVSKQIKEFAAQHGKLVRVDAYNKKYVPNDPNLTVIIVVDHIGLVLPVKGYMSKKERIDKMSAELRKIRDTYGFIVVVVSQFNRDISNPIRLKNGDVEPALDDFKDSSNTQEDADVVMALFDPMRYKVKDPSGYDLDELVSDSGEKFFRSCRVIKNSYGTDDVRIGLAFSGAPGIFKELPRLKHITEEVYEDVRKKTYFEEKF